MLNLAAVLHRHRPPSPLLSFQLECVIAERALERRRVWVDAPDICAALDTARADPRVVTVERWVSTIERMPMAAAS